VSKKTVVKYQKDFGALKRTFTFPRERGANTVVDVSV
jgi:hypothetical protein